MKLTYVFSAALVAIALVALPAVAQTSAPTPKKPKAAKPAAAEPEAPPADAAAPADPAAGDPAAPVEPPPPPPPGFVVVNVDVEGLSAVIAGEVHGLKVGANRFELPAGPAKVDLQGKDGKTIKSYDVSIESSKDAAVDVVMTGKLVVTAKGDMAVNLDGKDVQAKEGKVEARVKGGEHSIVVTQPGHVGIKSKIEVMAGRTHAIDPQLASFDPGNRTLAWVSILGGGALILAATVVEAVGQAGEFGGESARWGIAGVGVVGFVGGTIMMKDILKKEANPPTEDGKFAVQVSRASLPTGLARR